MIIRKGKSYVTQVYIRDDEELSFKNRLQETGAL